MKAGSRISIKDYQAQLAAAKRPQKMRKLAATDDWEKQGGAFGSALGSRAWAYGGWSGVCWCGGAFGTIGLLPLLMVGSVRNDGSRSSSS